MSLEIDIQKLKWRHFTGNKEAARTTLTESVCEPTLRAVGLISNRDVAQLG